MFINDLFESQQTTLVIIPGGFHPFHPGHLSLYRSAQKAFPGATIVYAATDDQKDRPFAFSDKQKLAHIAGVPEGAFQLVRSPFVAREITSQYDPNTTVLIFARSEKDRNEPPQPGTIKKDGSPSYLQPYHKGKLAPMSEHGYMAYLPVVKFDAGPSGVTSATQIRSMWPKADDSQKNAIISDLYPQNPAVAKRILDKYLSGGLSEDSEQTQYSITNSNGKELRTINANSPKEAFDLAVKLIGSNEGLRKSFGLVKLTPKPHYIVRNGQNQGVAEDSTDEQGTSVDEILYHLTSAYRSLQQHSDFYYDFDTITRVYETLRSYLKAGDIAGFHHSYAEMLGRYPDAASELIDAMFESAGIPSDTGTIEQFLDKCSQQDVAEGAGGGEKFTDFTTWENAAKQQGLRVSPANGDHNYSYHAIGRGGEVFGKFLTTRVPQNNYGYIRQQGVAEDSQPNDIAVYHHTGPDADKKAQALAKKLGSEYGHFRHDMADKYDNLHVVTQKRYFPDYAKQQGVAEAGLGYPGGRSFGGGQQYRYGSTDMSSRLKPPSRPSPEDKLDTASQKIAKDIAKGKKKGVAEGEGQMSKTKALNALRKELMNSYEYMKCGNLEEFKQRLQWLSEGMLKNHMTGGKSHIVNMKEIELYQDYCEKREQIQHVLSSQGVAEGSEEDSYSDKFVQSQIDYSRKHILSGTAADRERINGSLNYYQHIKNKRIKDGTWSLEQGVAEGLLDKFVKPKMKFNIETAGEELYVDVTLGGKRVAGFTFDMIGDDLEAQDMSVSPEYRGQGIAQTVYDMLKAKGFRINRSQHQTDAGSHFWDKNKGAGSKVWEQGVAEDSVGMDPTVIQMKKRAKVAHPFATSDEEALALYVADRSRHATKELRTQQDHEMAMINRIEKAENTLEHEVARIDQELARLATFKAK